MNFKSSFQRVMCFGSIISFVCMLLFFGGNMLLESRVLFSLGVTSLTFFYHLAVRLLIGECIVIRFNEAQLDYRSKWFLQKEWETKLYKMLHVKKWKTNMPTYSPDEFDIKKHSMEEIVQATCRSEIVHELNVLVSFVSLLFTLFFGDFCVFLFTAIAAACLDLVFVIMQRFNRPRLVQMIKKRG